MTVNAIILARGGSKGIPKKNIIDFCGKPLIFWTIDQCLKSKYINNVWVSSESDEILDIATKYGSETIKRPIEISGDFVSSEVAWLHAIDYIKKKQDIDIIVAPQVTSPLRESKDFDKALEQYKKNGFDSMFSSSISEDLFLWQKNALDGLESINYDYINRKRRQDNQLQIIENGSFYIFTSEIIKKYKNRFGGKIGHFQMEFWKMIEIDNIEDLRICNALMKEFLL